MCSASYRWWCCPLPSLRVVADTSLVPGVGSTWKDRCDEAGGRRCKKMQDALDQWLEEYDLFCEGRLDDPYPFLSQLRREDPIHWSEKLNCWVLTRYDDNVDAYTN